MKIENASHNSKYWLTKKHILVFYSIDLQTRDQFNSIDLQTNDHCIALTYKHVLLFYGIDLQTNDLFL